MRKADSEEEVTDIFNALSGVVTSVLILEVILVVTAFLGVRIRPEASAHQIAAFVVWITACGCLMYDRRVLESMQNFLIGLAARQYLRWTWLHTGVTQPPTGGFGQARPGSLMENCFSPWWSFVVLFFAVVLTVMMNTFVILLYTVEVDNRQPSVPVLAIGSG